MTYSMIGRLGAAALLGCQLLPPAGVGMPRLAGSDVASRRPDGGWLQLTYPEGRFRISLPAAPAVRPIASETEYGPLAGVVYTCEAPDGDLFLVSYVDFPDDAFREGAERVMRGLRDGFLNACDGKVVKERSIDLAGHRGLECEIELAGQGRLVWRVYVVEGRVYQLVVRVGENKGLAAGRAAAFLESFRLIPRKPA